MESLTTHSSNLASRQTSSLTSPLASSDQACITVNACTAFQLLLCGSTAAVRDAAAEALWPRVHADACHLECSDAPFESLPFSERVAALLVASVITRNPKRATRHRVVPLYHFMTPPLNRWTDTPQRVFRFGCAEGSSRVINPSGESSSWKRASAFVLPGGVVDTIVQLNNWGQVEGAPYKDAHRWSINEQSIHLDLTSRVYSRALAVRLMPAIVSASGETLGDFDSDAYDFLRRRTLPLNSSLILRLEAGGLEGAVLSFANRMPMVRGRVPRDVTLSFEIGSSIDAPLVATKFKGDLSPRYDLEGLVKPRVDIPLCNGDTIESLDEIARAVGVWHGGRVRGSFAYHPLRAKRSLQADAAASVNSATTAREVA